MSELESKRRVLNTGDPGAHAPGTGSCTPQAPPGESISGCGRRTQGVCFLLFLATVLIFLPSLRGGFLGYDDNFFVTANPHVQSGLTWTSVCWTFSHPVAGNWHPLTLLSHMLDCQVYGLRPWGHHLTSVLLHALNTVLLFVVFHRMTGALWRCAVLAALFGLHPLRVESVAWVAERKDVLSVTFWLLTMLLYARYVRQSQARNREARVSYRLALVFFGCGLMSKPMLVTLPFVLLLLDYWPLRRFTPGTGGSKTLLCLLREKVPFFALSAGCSVITYLLQQKAGAVTTGLSLGFRVSNAAVGYARYIGKLFWPSDLTVFYPYPQELPAWQVSAAAALLLCIFVSVLFLRSSRPYLAVGWLWFWGTLLPVIGLVQVGLQSVADRYTYMPLIGLFLMLVWGADDLASRWRLRTLLSSGAAGATILLCAVLTLRQTSYWNNDETLWLHALDVTGSNSVISNGLGVAYYNRATKLTTGRDLDEAIRYYERSLSFTPADADVHSGLAYALARQQRFGDAAREYELSLSLNPTNAETHKNLGILLGREGRETVAIQHLAEAVRLKPNYSDAHYNLGVALASQGRSAEAAVQFRETIRLDPNYPAASQQLEQIQSSRQKLEQLAAPYRQALQSNPGDAQAHSNLGRVLLEAGQLDEAIAEYTESVRLDPKSAQNQYQLGVALARKGEAEKASRQFELTLQREPTFAAAHYALGVICRQLHRMPEAVKHWREAVRLSPNWPDPLNNLAWVLATDPHPDLRDGAEAVRLASRAAALSGTNNVGVLDTLAAAYAEGNRFGEAAETARRAQVAATAQSQPGLAEQIQQRLRRYESRQPYREEPGGKE